MLIKVCGIKYQENLDAISRLDIDMIGLNFYPPSKRYLSSVLDFKRIKDGLDLVGVFVDARIEDILIKKEEYNLTYAQLHGNESVEYCRELSDHLRIIKAFSISSTDDLERASEYDAIEYFLFDTKGESVGGTGRKFDWKILNHYKGSIPFLLAGGIGPHDVEAIKLIDHPAFAGVDINSRFEIEPGRKSAPLVDAFIKKLKE